MAPVIMVCTWRTSQSSLRIHMNYTDRELIPLGPLEVALEPTFKATKLRRFKYNTSVEIVFQSTALLKSDCDPIHLRGYDFFVLTQGSTTSTPRGMSISSTTTTCSSGTLCRIPGQDGLPSASSQIS